MTWLEYHISIHNASISSYVCFLLSQLLHLITLSLIAIMMVHPDILKQSGNGHGGISSGTEQLSVEPLDVQAVNCGKEMPCILAAQGDGNTDQVTSDFSLSLSNFMTTHRPNTGTGDSALLELTIVTSCFCCWLLPLWFEWLNHEMPR